MNFQELKLLFRKASGRYDLIGPSGEDLGGAIFIQWGQDFLNQQISTFWNNDVSEIIVKEGKFSIPVPYCRSVDKVRISDTDNRYGNFSDLSKVLESHIRSEFPDLYDASIRGVPKYWAVSVMRPDEGYRKMFQHKFQYVNQYGTLSILIAPPPDASYMLEVTGVFCDMPFNSEESESFWSIRYPNVLVHAACYQLELFYRNTEGAKDWLNAITIALDAIDRDEARKYIKERMVMGA